MDSTAASSTSGRPKRKCVTEAATEKLSVLPGPSIEASPTPSKKKVKKFTVTPLRVPIPTDQENCKFSDDLADSVRTLCQICEASVTLTGMRSHTMLKHKLQITKYKELHGPFEIIEHVYHKCHICDKILLLDSDAMGAHIKGIHKMKEKLYKEQFMINSNQLSKAESSSGKTGAVKKKAVKSDDDPEVEYDLKTTFPDYEYSCALKHCELCGRDGASVDLDGSDNEEQGIKKEDEIATIQTGQVEEDGEPMFSCIGQGGWSKKLLLTDVLLGEDFKMNDDDSEKSSIDYSEESLLVSDSGVDSSSDSDSADEK